MTLFYKNVGHNWASLQDSSRRRLVHGIINCHLKLLRFVYEIRPIPLSYWVSFRSAVAPVSRSTDPILPNENCVRSSGASLPIRELRELLRHDLLGTWAMDADTITFL